MKKTETEEDDGDCEDCRQEKLAAADKRIADRRARLAG